MKHSRIFSLATGLLLFLVCATLFSFSEKKGGDSFTIHLGSRLLVQQYVARDEGVKTISLRKASDHENLLVQYNHCGKVGTDRTLTLRSVESGNLKTFKFPNADGTTSASMICPVKDILTLQKNSHGPWSLIYTSKEIPAGKTLVSIVPTDDTKASLH